MTDEELNHLALEASEALTEKWSIGTFSRFCDDPPDFYAADNLEIAELLKPFFQRANSAGLAAQYIGT